MGAGACSLAQNQQITQTGPKYLCDVGDYFKQMLNNSERYPNSANSYKYTKGNLQLNRLMCLLQQHHILFEDHICPSQDLLQDSGCSWERVQIAFKNEEYKTTSWEFQYDDLRRPKYENLGFKKAMHWLTKHPSLLDQANMFPTMFYPGLYRFMLWVGGTQKQVVIDSQIPVNFQKRYLFASPKKGSGVWMVLMEKALAKSIGNYHLLQSFSTNQIVSEITGFPCPSLYLEEHQRRSYELRLKPRQSQFFKIGKFERGKIAIGLWFPPKESKQALDKHVIVELIQQTKVQNANAFTLIETKVSKSRNVLMVTSQKGEMIDLVMDEEYLHIFNWNEEDLNCSLVVQSEKDSRIWLNQSNDITYKQYKTIKNKMVKNQYSKWHQDPSTTLLNASTYKLRIKQIRHRLIFCVKNKLEQTQKIILKIKPQRKKQVFFEDQPQQLQKKEVHIKKGEHKFFIFNKVRTVEYGQFYVIQL